MSSNNDIVVLQSNDDVDFHVRKGVACMSNTIKNMIDDLPEEDLVIPLPNLSANTLGKVLEYCEWHYDNPNKYSRWYDYSDNKCSDDIIDWDLEFCKVDNDMLYQLILAANYLDIETLLDVTCKTVANMIKGKSAEEIRKIFNIVNDYTPEEEEQVRLENSWCEKY